MKTNLFNPLKQKAGATALALLLLNFAWFASCTTPQSVAYFQDAEYLNNMAVEAEQQFRLRPEDKINIIVNSSNPMLEQQFTLRAGSGSSNVLGASVTPMNMAGRTGGSGVMIAYTVDEQGTINFPILGKISVGGKTRKEVAEYIEDRLIARELVDDPIVTVEYVNMGINVLGEVNSPGHKDINRDHFTIIDAIASAGDLTINGKRTNIMVSRKVNGALQTYFLDLTNMQQTMKSEAYYLQQNDLVYVAPNHRKMRESRAVGNTFNTPGIWLSLASFGMTAITFIMTMTR